MEKYYTPEDLAGIFKMNKRTIYRFIRSKKIGSYKMGRQWRVSEKQLNEFLDKTERQIVK